jgi:hypothetical protein
MVYHCFWNTTFVYVFAEFFGAAVAALLMAPVHGIGEFAPERLQRWIGGGPAAPPQPAHWQVLQLLLLDAYWGLHDAEGVVYIVRRCLAAQPLS